MPSIFHYTDSAGLLGILQSQCLFATDYRYLNDLSEGTMARDLLVSVFEAELKQVTPKLVAKRLLDKRIFDDDKLIRLQAESTYDALVKSLNRSTPTFVLSFCRHEKPKAIEHGLLSQWRAYTGSAGFAIEFDDLELDKLIKVENSTFAYAIMKSEDVRYKDYETLFDLKKYAGVASEIIRLAFEPRDVSAITGKIEIDPVVADFALNAFYAKNYAFEEEQEYRIVGARVRKDKIRAGATRREKEIKFRAKGGLVVPYVVFLKRPKRRLPITSIIVGPHPYQEKQADAVMLALQSSPFAKAKVRLSNIPLKL